MTNRPVSPSRRRARELEREARDMGSRKRREFVILLLGYGREGRDIAHLYDYFMVRPVTHTHTRAGRQWLEALHHARSRRFPVYNPAGLCVCVCVRARVSVWKAQRPPYLLNVSAHVPRTWVDVAARVFHAHRSHGSTAPRSNTTEGDSRQTKGRTRDRLRTRVREFQIGTVHVYDTRRRGA